MLRHLIEFPLGMYHELKSLKKVTSEFIQTITSMTVSTEDNMQASQGSDLLQSSCAGLQQSCRSLSLLCPPPIPTCNVHCTHVKSLLFVYPSLSWNSFRRNPLIIFFSLSSSVRLWVLPFCRAPLFLCIFCLLLWMYNKMRQISHHLSQKTLTCHHSHIEQHMIWYFLCTES